jgi:MYXO-CTERM domain-containing protein
MKRQPLVFVVALMGASAVSAGAWAQSEESLEALVEELSEHGSTTDTELASGACVAACAALESMERAADRICALDPGAPCDQAQQDVEAARARVRSACPDCSTARDEAVAEPPRPAPEPLHSEAGADDAQPIAMSPMSEERRGGCAACAIGDERDGGQGALALLIGAAGLMLRRRRRRR